MCDPARQAPDREEHREHPGRKPHRLVDDPRVEVDVGVQLSLDEVVVGERELFELFGDVEQVVLNPERGEHLVGTLFDEFRPWIEVLVDPVPKAHEFDALVFVLHAFDELVDTLAGCLDLAQHLQHRLVRPTVKRTVQGADASGDRREHVDLSGADHPHRRGGCVLLVVLMQDEQSIERPGDNRVHLVGLGHRAEVELQEVVDEAQ